VADNEEEGGQAADDLFFHNFSKLEFSVAVLGSDERRAIRDEFRIDFQQIRIVLSLKIRHCPVLCGIKDGGYLNLLCNTIAPMAVRNPARLTATETNSSKNFKILILNVF